MARGLSKIDADTREKLKIYKNVGSNRNSRNRSLQFIRTRNNSIEARIRELRAATLFKSYMNITPQEVSDLLLELDELQNATEDLFQQFSQNMPDRPVQLELNRIIKNVDLYKVELVKLAAKLIAADRQLYPQVMEIATQIKNVAERKIKTAPNIAVNLLKRAGRDILNKTLFNNSFMNPKVFVRRASSFPGEVEAAFQRFDFDRIRNRLIRRREYDGFEDNNYLRRYNTEDARKSALDELKRKIALFRTRNRELWWRNKLRIPIDITPQDLHIMSEQLEYIADQAQTLFEEFQRERPDRAIQVQLNELIKIIDGYREQVLLAGMRHIRAAKQLYPNLNELLNLSSKLANRRVRAEPGTFNPINLIRRTTRNYISRNFRPSMATSNKNRLLDMEALLYGANNRKFSFPSSGSRSAQQTREHLGYDDDGGLNNGRKRRKLKLDNETAAYSDRQLQLETHLSQMQLQLERAKLSIYRKATHRDGEHQEWEKDYWTNFQRNLFRRLDRRSSGRGGGGGSGLAGLLGAGLRSLGVLGVGLSRFLRLGAAVAVARGLASRLRSALGRTSRTNNIDPPAAPRANIDPPGAAKRMPPINDVPDTLRVPDPYARSHNVPTARITEPETLRSPDPYSRSAQPERIGRITEPETLRSPDPYIPRVAEPEIPVARIPEIETLRAPDPYVNAPSRPPGIISRAGSAIGNAASSVARSVGRGAAAAGRAASAIAKPLAVLDFGMAVANAGEDTGTVAGEVDWRERLSAGAASALTLGNIHSTVSGIFTSDRTFSNQAARYTARLRDMQREHEAQLRGETPTNTLAKAQDLAKRIMRGERVPASEIGNDRNLINAIGREMMLYSDDQNAAMVYSGARNFDLSGLPDEMRFIANPNSRGFLDTRTDPSSYVNRMTQRGRFTMATQALALSGLEALSNYWQSISSGQAVEEIGIGGLPQAASTFIADYQRFMQQNAAPASNSSQNNNATPIAPATPSGDAATITPPPVAPAPTSSRPAQNPRSGRGAPPTVNPAQQLGFLPGGVTFASFSAPSAPYNTSYSVGSGGSNNIRNININPEQVSINMNRQSAQAFGESLGDSLDNGAGSNSLGRFGPMSALFGGDWINNLIRGLIGANLGQVERSLSGIGSSNSSNSINNSSAGVSATRGVTGITGGVAAGVAGGGALGDLIARAESGRAGYNAYNRGVAGDSSTPIDLENMPISEVMRRQALPRSHPDRLFAVGRYQAIPNTLRDAVNRLGIDPNETFNQANQDRIFRDYLIGEKRPEIRGFITGAHNDAERAQLGLAREFAAVANPATGRSYYDGQAGNAASINNQRAQGALHEARRIYQERLAAGDTHQQAYLAATSSIRTQTNQGNSALAQAAPASPTNQANNIATPAANAAAPTPNSLGEQLRRLQIPPSNNNENELASAARAYGAPIPAAARPNETPQQRQTRIAAEDNVRALINERDIAQQQANPLNNNTAGYVNSAPSNTNSAPSNRVGPDGLTREQRNSLATVSDPARRERLTRGAIDVNNMMNSIPRSEFAPTNSEANRRLPFRPPSNNTPPAQSNPPANANNNRTIQSERNNQPNGIYAAAQQARSQGDGGAAGGGVPMLIEDQGILLLNMADMA